MRFAIAAALVLAAVAAHAAPPSLGSRTRAAVSSSATASETFCKTAEDHAGRYIYHPENQCCAGTGCSGTATTGSAYKRWTRECVATAEGQPFIVIGPGSETSLGLSGTFKYQTDSCFLDRPGSQNITGDNQKTYVFDIERIAAENSKPNPLFFLAIRNDIADAYDLGASETDLHGSFNRNWLLKTTRAWEGANSVNAYFTALNNAAISGTGDSGFSGCRYPSNIAADPATPNDLWSSVAGCAGTVSCDTGEFCKTPYIMSATNVTDRQNAVYYVFFRDGFSQKTFYPSGMLADITNPHYREWLIRYLWLRMEREHMDGFEMAHKLHRWWDAATRTRFEPWIVTGDGLGTLNGATKRLCPGSGGSDDTNVTTLAQIANGGTNPCDYLLTGMPLIRASDSDYAVNTEFTYPMYVEGVQAFGHLAYTNVPRLPYLIHVNPYWYDKCTAGTVFTAANGYTDASCVDAGTGYDKFDDPATVGVNEAALIRQWVQEAGYVVIDRNDGVTNDLLERAPTNCSPLPCDGGMGSGGGSGLSSAQLKAMIEGGSPAPIRVEIYDSTYPRITTPKLAGSPSQVNPEPSLTVPTFPAECTNGVDDDADGLEDLADPGCSSAADTDETDDGLAECGDSIDNDSDGLTDYPTDTGCQGALDPRERGQCQDGIDNDSDGTTDYPADSNCTSATDDNEFL